MLFSSLSRRERYVVGILSAVAFALRIPLAFRPERLLAWLPYTDDAFYLFSIARNVAHGYPPSIDGVHLTNGFQPLIVLLYIPIFWLCGSDSWLAVRWTFILNGLIAAISIWLAALAARAVERRALNRPNRDTASSSVLTAPILAAAIWTFSFPFLEHLTNGLETGLFSMLLLVLILQSSAIFSREETGQHRSVGLWILVGTTLGLTVLARIDAAILTLIWFLLLCWKRKFVPAMTIAGFSLLLSAPWWIYNWTSFGSLMPTSGQAENSWPLPPFENITQATKAISDILTLDFFLPGALGPLLRTAWAVLLVGGVVFACYRAHRMGLLNRIRIDMLFPFLVFGIVLIFFYTFFFRAPHFISRYFQPLRIVWSLVAAIAIASLWKSTNRFTRTAIVIWGAAGLFFGIHQYCVYYPSDRPFEFYDVGVWANQHPEEKIAMLQSGIASFVAPNIVNLDGKVNTDALRAHQQGRLGAYLRNEHFTYIADFKPFIEDIDTLARKDELIFDSVGIIGNVQLMKRRAEVIRSE